MIVSSIPRIGHAVRGIVVPLAILFAWDVIVTIVFFWEHPRIMQLEMPLSLFGTALALFLGFRDNSAYARWWEARSLWGLMINGSRNVAREVLSLCEDSLHPRRAGLARDLVRGQIAYVHQMRFALRGQPDGPEIRQYLGADRSAKLQGIANKPNAILLNTAMLLKEAFQTGMIDAWGRVRIETTLVDLANAQGGMERIKRTPMPSQYRFFPAFFTHVFCVILPLAVVRDLGIYTPIGSACVGLMFLILLQIGDDLMDPFSDEIYDVPMTAMCRTVEIDLLQMLGEPAPEPIKTDNGVLW